MIKKTVLAVTVVAALLMTGCSSYPDSAMGVGKAVCDAFKKGDLESAKKYMSVSALQQTQNSESLISKFFALPEFKEKAANLNCAMATDKKVLSSEHEIIYFGDFNVEVKLIDDDWKMIR